MPRTSKNIAALLDAGEVVDIGTVDVNGLLRDLMDVAKVALGPDQPVVREDDGTALMALLLTVIDRTMPDELQDQDPRVANARALLAIVRLGGDTPAIHGDYALCDTGECDTSRPNLQVGNGG